ncbi:hypothetical protein A2961_00195 [Candidatus Woesebacteria bacterium RIFCSPLOWO2_01_FULL_39_21]|uniref:Uncharacterized protein n=1 Tax=Candidatus Woesebacteria bacterium RIFCSPLOWO2_01_FULL_39_21 TaxID=1802519 RepID=A0A1F8BJP9_9BACT|nr:MAG: hypothetical protein A2691_01015 [Candidatus Woesebacteria bacterium RIFCSPHIGHO2_01_FULL_39_23]OGM64297.1 MAG: hypothetical protein A2961_00195 [Candidatus Woesebacteria bacterium RIFCSPLOWO2_01_FULL_39_21]
MRIAVFHTEFAYSGGAEKLIFREVDQFVSTGHKVDIYTAFADREKCYPEEIGRYNIKQILPEFLDKLIPHEGMIILTTLLFPFVFIPYHILRATHYDIFFGHNQAGPWWAAMMGILLGKPYFTYNPYPSTYTHPRNIDNKKANPVFALLDKFFITHARVCFANGKYAKRICERVYKREFINCPAGAERGQFSKRIWGERWKNPYILITNRHFPAKRIEYGIEIISELKTPASPADRQNSKLRLVITGGETDHTNKLRSLAKRLDVGKRVFITGLVGKKRLTSLYKYALCYIYTAPEEDLGMGIVEAMAAGVPVVAWDNAGPKYIVKQGNTGYLAEPFSQEDFSGCVRKITIDKLLNLKMSQNSYRESKKYSWRKHNRILLKNIANYV